MVVSSNLQALEKDDDVRSEADRSGIGRYQTWAILSAVSVSEALAGVGRDGISSPKAIHTKLL